MNKHPCKRADFLARTMRTRKTNFPFISNSVLYYLLVYKYKLCIYVTYRWNTFVEKKKLDIR